MFAPGLQHNNIHADLEDQGLLQFGHQGRINDQVQDNCKYPKFRKRSTLNLMRKNLMRKSVISSVLHDQFSSRKEQLLRTNTLCLRQLELFHEVNYQDTLIVK